MTVFCDESGNAGTDHLVVAAVAIEDDALNAEISALREEHDRVVALAERSGVPASTHFEEKGFHKHEDNFGTQAGVVKVLSTSLNRKVFIAGTDRSSLADLPEVEHMLALYQFLGETIIRKFIEYDRIKFVIERNDILSSRLESLEDAWRSSTGFRSLLITQEPKSAASPLSESDYFASACAHWMNVGMSPPKTREVVYLQFVNMLPSVSFVWSLEKGRLHSRKHPWAPVLST